MKFRTGTMLGAYEILGPLGVGGMGEVYRARDSRLKREVAIKVLPDAFALDAERVARFQREAEVLASLNHRHIAAIHDLAQFEDSRLLILELVEGDTLADRIARGPIAMDEVLRIAKQIAEALEAAHEKGIVHRDLKPANIKLAPSGDVKVLDFGLAKVRARETSAEDLTNTATILTMLSPGVIMGTAAYMSPEQARGIAADARSDIWAFGVLLFEMLTGKPVFAGDTIAEVLGGVLKAEPDWSSLPEGTPQPLRSLIRRCLRKDRNQRLRDIADARIEIDELLREPSEAFSVRSFPIEKRKSFWKIPVFAAAAVVIAGLGYYARVPAPSPEVRLMVVTQPGAGLTSFALSPDGRHVVFQATTEGKTQLWLRPLASEASQPLTGTDGGTFPFWSPDSRSIGFFADQRLKRIDIEGGVARELAQARYAVGGTWNREGTILFGPSTTGPLYTLPADGGRPTEVTHVNPPLQVSHRFPFFLPDGKHFLFFAAGTQEGQGLYVGSVDRSEAPKRVFDDIVTAVFAPPDRLVFLRQGKLFHQRLDLGTLSLTENPVPIASGVVSTSSSRLLAEGALSVSETGLVAYRTDVAEPRQLAWFDRSGKQTGVLGETDSRGGPVRLSPDGQQVAFARTVNAQRDLWLMETARGVLTRLTSDGMSNEGPVWSPDGKQIAFTSRRSGPQRVYVRRLVGADSSEKALVETSENNIADAWSPDGRFILYERESSQTGLDLWTLELETRMTAPAVEQTGYDEAEGRFSPDGEWIAYRSNESGRPEIYVRSFPPGPGGKIQISTNGGLNPQWNRNGREIFFMGLDDRLMSADIALQKSGVQVEVPRALFATRPGSQFNVASDGTHFLVNTFIQDVSTPPITVILNWGK